MGGTSARYNVFHIRYLNIARLISAFTGCTVHWITIAAGPESLVDYFQKGALLGQKVVLKFSKTFPEHLKVRHISNKNYV